MGYKHLRLSYEPEFCLETGNKITQGITYILVTFYQRRRFEY